MKKNVIRFLVDEYMSRMNHLFSCNCKYIDSCFIALLLSGSSLQLLPLSVSMFSFPQGWAGPSGTYCIHPPLHT